MRETTMSKKQGSMTKVKICGLFRSEDIDYVNEAKPDFIGLVFAESRRRVTAEQARKLKQKLDPEIKAVGVFVDASLEEPLRLIREGTIDIVQLHGKEDEAYIRELKEKTGCPVIKAVRVESREDICRMQSCMADFLLLDHGPGGTGKSFDWSHVPEYGKKKFFLAGGIEQSNVTRAVSQLKPYAVDVSSGVETCGVKDRKKILDIVAMIRNMD